MDPYTKESNTNKQELILIDLIEFYRHSYCTYNLVN